MKHSKLAKDRFSQNQLKIVAQSSGTGPLEIAVKTRKEDATSAEVLWACKSAKSNYSLASSVNISEVNLYCLINSMFISF